eukprot:4012768-Pyramimonas_sp.AAC.1
MRFASTIGLLQHFISPRLMPSYNMSLDKTDGPWSKTSGSSGIAAKRERLPRTEPERHRASGPQN